MNRLLGRTLFVLSCFAFWFVFGVLAGWLGHAANSAR